MKSPRRIHDNDSLTRREFLWTTAIAAGALTTIGPSLQAATKSAKFKPNGLIDTNVWLGRWPFRRLPNEEPSALAARLRHNGVTQAWAGSFNGLLGPEKASNERLAKECRGVGRQFFVPFGTVNPKSAEWREELRRCHEEHRMPGLRLVPNYHGYTLDEPGFTEVLALASEFKLLIQLVVEIEDQRVQPAPPRPPVDVSPLPALLKIGKPVRLMLLNWYRAVKPDLMKELAGAGVMFDIAMVEGVGGVGSMLGQLASGLLVFGSNSPFFYFESALLKLKEAALPRAQVTTQSLAHD